MIKLNDEDITAFNISRDDVKVLTNEMIDILKNNLDDEYFNNEKETLVINDKKVYTTRHSLNLNSKEIYELKLAIIDDIKINDKVISVLEKINGSTKSEIITDLNSYRNELEENVSENFSVELYTNVLTKNVVKIVIGSDENKISFVKSAKDHFDITSTESNITNLVGTLDISDDNIKITYKYDDMNLEYEIKNDEIYISLLSSELELKASIINKDNKTSYLYEITVGSEDYKLKISIDGVLESVDKISNKDVSDYIYIEEISEEDVMNISAKLYENEALINLIEDFSSIYGGFMEEYDYSSGDDTIMMPTI